MKKRIISILIALCLVLTMLPMTAAADTETVQFTEYNVSDTTTWTLQTLDGGTINQSTYSGSFRFFVFALCNCINSQGAVRWLAGSEWATKNDIEIIVVFDDYSTLEQKKQFKQSTAPGNSSIIFAYGDPAVVSSMRYYYMRNTLNPQNLLTYALGVIVDKDNIVRRAMSSMNTYSVRPFIESAVNDYLYRIESTDTISFDINGTFDYDETAEVYRQLNALRSSLGLSPLKLDKKLMDVAMQRAAETSIYYSHTRPNGEDCFSLIPFHLGTAGENIAAGQTNATNVMTAWTNSPGHYKNMINPDFDSVGIGCFYQDGAKYWVQFFTGGAEAELDSRTGKVNKNATIKATGSNLNIKVMSKDENVIIDIPQQLGLYNQNITLSDSFKTKIIAPLTSSSDTSIATINSDGVVTGLQVGNAWIRMGISDSLYWEKILM